MEELSNYLTKVKVPRPNDKVYKDECVLSFDTPVSILQKFHSTNFYLRILL